MFQVGILQMAFTLTIMLLNIPAGILTDKLGRKTILIVNTVFYFFGWLLYAMSYSFVSFLIAEIVMGISVALWTAVGSTFVYDVLLSIKEESRYKKVFGNVTAINYSMWGIAALFGSYFATYSLRLPVYLTLIPVTIALLVTFTFKEPEVHKKIDTHYLTHLKEAVKYSANHEKVRLLMVYIAIFYATGFGVFILYQPYLKSLSIPIIYFGVVYFLSNMGSALMAKYAHKIELRFGEKNSLVWIILSRSILIVLMGFMFGPIGAIMPILIFSIGGYAETVLADYIHKHVESSHRGTVMALSNFVTNLASSIVMPFLGFLVDFYSLGFAFLVSGVITLLNVIVIWFMYKKKS